MAKSPPRNIVLLSDGTGNSAAKLAKTNVWRIYQALDLENKDQLAFYDDGVGTGGFQLLRALGGAFGFGLARNVRQLYEELCRHYETNDKIMLFGFSRGAFTVRVLSGLIDRCGVIDRNSDNTVDVWSWSKFRWVKLPVASDAGLKAAVRIAYRAMKKSGNKAPVSRAFRFIRELVLRHKTPKWRDFRKQYAIEEQHPIEFLGVFDTVSAYGLPIDELAIAIHKHLYSLRFPNNILSDNVQHAYQALALDEGRHTFHPVLWTERKYRPKGQEGPPDPKPQQVWFTGMHTDVGGGYADERLSLVPAIWMIEQAETKAGLKFRSAAVSDLKKRSTEHGKMHDSRRGLAAFYRYKPRILEKLGNEDLDGNGYTEVRIDRFKIHHSVFDRIRGTDADYAPVGIPRDYDVAMPSSGKKSNIIVSAEDAGIESTQDRERRADGQKSLEATILLRQITYFIMLGLALILVAVPFLWLANPAATGDGPASKLVGLLLAPLAFLPVPGTARIQQFWVEEPYLFLVLAAGFIGSYLYAGNLKRSLQSKAQSVWRHLTDKPDGTAPAPQEWVHKGRSLLGGAYGLWTRKIMPFALIVLLFIALPALVAWRWYMFHPYQFGSVCEVQRTEATSYPFEFSTADPCMESSFELKQDHFYIIRIKITEPWVDKTFAADPTGLKWSQMQWGDRVMMASLSFTRRFWSEDWFAMMGSIGRAREFAFRIDAKQEADDSPVYSYRFRAWRSGKLYLFVNDALVPGRDLYANNQGRAEIELIEDGQL